MTKIIKASNDQNISINDLTSKITENFHEDCKYLKCETPNSEPKATENIKQMIEMITELEKKGFAYSKDKHVYFEVKKFSDYGKLSNKKLDELIAGSRVEVSEIKKILKILYYGNHQQIKSLHGNLLGAKADQVGT